MKLSDISVDWNISVDWKTVGLQLVLWLIALGVTLLVVRWVLPTWYRLAKSFSCNAAVIAVIALILLSLIPNLKFGGSGRTSDGTPGGAMPGGTPLSGGGDRTSLGSGSLRLRIARRSAFQYEVWLESHAGARLGPVELRNSPTFRGELSKLLQQARKGNVEKQPTAIGLLIPPSMSSDVAEAVLEDILRSDGFVVQPTSS